MLLRKNELDRVVKNHSTALEFPTEVEKYIDKESAEKVIIGSFPSHKLDHCSPMLSMPKEGRHLYDTSMTITGIEIYLECKI